MPRPLASAAMLGALAAGLPIDFLASAAGRTRARAWHKVFIVEAAS